MNSLMYIVYATWNSCAVKKSLHTLKKIMFIWFKLFSRIFYTTYIHRPCFKEHVFIHKTDLIHGICSSFVSVVL